MNNLRLKFKKGFQKRLLLELIKQNNLSQRKLSKFLLRSRRTIRLWIEEKALLPEEIYQKLIKKYPPCIKYDRFILDKKPNNWGQIKGGKIRYNQLKNNNKFKDHHKKMLKKIIKPNPISFPKQSNFFKKVKTQNIDHLSLLISLLMTDGCLMRRSVFFTNKDRVLLNIFIDILSHISKANIRIRLRRKNIFEISAYDSILVKKLLKRSPTFKTSPQTQTKKGYLNGPQPTIKYLFKQNLKTKIACVRLALTSDGCLSFNSESKDEFRKRANLHLACAHPSLTKQWKELFEQVGLKCSIIKQKDYWGGIKGISTRNLKTINKFRELGGFAEGVKISKKSKFLWGYEKNRLLDLVCNYNSKTFKSWNDIYELI